MPSVTSPLIATEFTRSEGPGNKKSAYLTCKHCLDYHYAYNATRAIAHLNNCSGYQDKKETLASSSNSSQKRQRTLTLSTIPVIQRRKLDSLAALAIYMSARPFRMWEDPYMRAFIGAATHDLYFPPNRDRIGGELLNQQYNEIKERVELLIQGQEKLNFVMDESPDISSRRIINLSVVIPDYGSIYLSNEDIGHSNLNSAFFTEWFLRKTAQYGLNRVSSLTTDTCATMRSIWRGLESLDQLAHVLFIPCDSHGLQLLIKDLLQELPITPIIKKAQEVVQAFHRSKKQYAILRSKQEKPIALVLAVITRWGTQLMLIRSLLQCKESLFAWLGDPKAQMGKVKGENSLATIITDHSFWQDLSTISHIISPIHEAQKSSESDGSTIAKVVPRWLKLEIKLRQLNTVYSSLMGSFMDPKIGAFTKRAQAQTTDLHYTAMLLDPISLLQRPSQDATDRGVRFLLARCKDEISKKYVHQSFLEYRTRGGVFGTTHPSSLHHDNPIAYWKSYLFDEQHLGLAVLAVRIFEAIGNSVSSERAFSTMNLIHTKLRNRLGAEKADKLIYIYMNQRVLSRNGSIYTGDPIEKTAEEQLELEEALIELLDPEDLTGDNGGDSELDT